MTTPTSKTSKTTTTGTTGATARSATMSGAGPTNLAVLCGAVTSQPVARELPAGGTVVQFDVTTLEVVGERTIKRSVPVAWNDPVSYASVEVGTEVVVIGSVNRRFFRVGGATQSRTEVVAVAVIPARRRKQVAAALASVAAHLV